MSDDATLAAEAAARGGGGGGRFKLFDRCALFTDGGGLRRVKATGGDAKAAARSLRSVRRSLAAQHLRGRRRSNDGAVPTHRDFGPDAE